MITARTIGQQVLDRLKKFTSDSDITENDCIIACQQALSTIVVQDYYQLKREEGLDGYDGSLYFTWFDQLVKDSEHGKYFDLPATIMSVPHGYAVRIMKNLKSRPYIPLPAGFNGMATGLRVQSLGGNMGFYILGDKGYFAETPGLLTPPENIVIQMLAPVMDVNPDAYMAIPANLQYRVIIECLKQFGVSDQLVADETKDDVDNKG